MEKVRMWPKVVTFDCYGTLVRWPETLRSVFDSIIPASADGAKFHKDFSEFHVQLKDGPYQPYSQVLRLALAATMQKWHLGNTASAQERLLREIQAIPPYPDVNPALRSIARTFRLAIISNTEDALIAGTVRGLEAPFEVITAQQAQAYKPDHRLFFYAHKHLGVSAGEALHVGAGYATDMAPAFELGMSRIWINRRGEKADPAMLPSAEIPDLSGLEQAISKVALSRDTHA
jgi:2-haloalkanoic acid dehalogenase type II